MIFLQFANGHASDTGQPRRNRQTFQPGRFEKSQRKMQNLRMLILSQTLRYERNSNEAPSAVLLAMSSFGEENAQYQTSQELLAGSYDERRSTRYADHVRTSD